MNKFVLSIATVIIHTVYLSLIIDLGFISVTWKMQLVMMVQVKRGKLSNRSNGKKDYLSCVDSINRSCLEALCTEAAKDNLGLLEEVRVTSFRARANNDFSLWV